MIDREKTLKELDRITSVLSDSYALLKGLNPIPVEIYVKDEWYGCVCVCPDCKAEWMSEPVDTHFCPRCGRSVKWNADK